MNRPPVGRLLARRWTVLVAVVEDHPVAEAPDVTPGGVENLGHVQEGKGEAVGGLLQGAVGGTADDTVDQQAAPLLKVPHGVVELVVEHVHRHVPAGGGILVRVVQQSECGERGTDLHDRTTAVPTTQSVSGRAGLAADSIAVAVAGTRHD